MNCNLEIHEGSESIDEIYCPFCYEQFENRQSNECERCCDNQDIIADKGYSVCKNCGQVIEYMYVNEYIEFYNNLYCIRKKSVYNLKYHLDNVICNFLYDYKIQTSHQQIMKIHQIYKKINEILPQIRGNRKSIISIKYIMKMILDMMKVENNRVIVTKSKH